MHFGVAHLTNKFGSPLALTSATGTPANFNTNCEDMVNHDGLAPSNEAI